MAESTFFSTKTPTIADECLKAFAALYHAVVPGVLTADLQLLRNGLREYQKLGMKKAEIAAQSPDVRRLLSALSKIPGCAYGMSSFGPLVFAVSDERDNLTSYDIRDAANSCGAHVFAHARGRNFGHRINGSKSVDPPTGQSPEIRLA